MLTQPTLLLTALSLPAQMPFANLKVGQVFFAVVHEKMRPPLDVIDQAKQDLPEEEETLSTITSTEKSKAPGTVGASDTRNKHNLWCC